MINRTTILTLIILTPIFLFGSATPQAQTTVPRDTHITLQRFSDAFGNGGFYRVIISSDGTVMIKRFKNPLKNWDPNAPAPQPIQTKIPIEKVAELVAEFERIKYFSLKDRYAKIEDGCPSVWTDQGGAETSITMNGKTKIVAHYNGCGQTAFGQAYPLELTALENKIDEIVGTKEWLKP